MRPTRRNRPSGSAAQAGQASVELALLLPVIAAIALAVIQVGLVGRDVLLVSHAAREAARAAAVDSAPDAARRAAADSSGLDPDRLHVTVSGRGEPGSRVTARVRYRSPTDVPLIGRLMGDHTITSEATMRVETE